MPTLVLTNEAQKSRIKAIVQDTDMDTMKPEQMKIENITTKDFHFKNREQLKQERQKN